MVDWFNVAVELYFCGKLHPSGDRGRRRITRLFREMKRDNPEEWQRYWDAVGAKLDEVLRSIPKVGTIAELRDGE